MKKLFRLFLLLVLVVSSVLAAIAWKARQFLTPAALATALEGGLNSRVHIGSVKVSLFSFPARVTLEDVQLGMRDAEIERAYDERAPMRGAPVQVGEVRLGVNLRPLLDRRLEVKELRLRDPKVSLMLFEKGGGSLDELFRSPDDDAGGAEEGGASSGSDTLNISQLGILASLQGLGIDDGELNIVMEKTSLSLRFEDLQVDLADLEIDPARLSSLPPAEVALAGTLLVDSSRQERARYGRLGFEGSARAQFFAPATGEFALVADCDLVLDEQSYLGTNIPAVAKSWDQLRKLDQFGVKIGPPPGKATFGRGGTLAVGYDGGRLTLAKPLSLVLDGWELALIERTWIQLEKDTHDAQGELVANRKVSARLHREMLSGAGKLPKEVRPEMVAAVDEAWFRDGRLHARIVSAGLLSKPSLDVVNKMPDMERMVKEAARRYALDQLEGLFGRGRKEE